MKNIKETFVNDKKSYIVSNLFFILISTIISAILINSKDISIPGGIILGIFQLFVLNTFWLVIEIKFKLDDIIKTKSMTDKIIQEFAESELLQDKFVTTLTNDLRFDKNIKKNLYHLKDAHMFFSKLKIETYFNEFFVFNPDKNIISDVPSAYFESKIWRKLINDTPYYYSVQKLTDKQLDHYIESSGRKLTEINVLKSRTGWKKGDFCKLFVIDDEYFDKNKVKEGTGGSDNAENTKYRKMYEYLGEWNDVEKAHAGSIKIVKASLAEGHQNEDIGIFGDFYGIQRSRNNDEKKIMREDLKIDFYFDVNDAKERRESFKQFFNSSYTISLSDGFFI